jgi:hypothetical protein
MGDERPTTASPFDATLAHQFVECAADRDQAAAIMSSQLTFGRELLTGVPPPDTERFEQVEIHLVMQRDGAELETKAGQPKRSSVVRWPGLRVLREGGLLITL